MTVAAACKGSGPDATTSSDPVVRGDELFRLACSRCHGAEGKGGPVGMLGELPARDFTDPIFQARVTDKDIGRTIRNGRKGMPAFAAVFTPDQVAVLTSRVRRFGPDARDAAGPDAPRSDR
jgi:mono/diheme cytochrome c family protein